MDGGNTIALLDYMGYNGGPLPEAEALKDHLLTLSPYLSDQSLRAAASMNILSEDQIMTVGAANPEILSADMLDHLQNGATPKPLSPPQVQMMMEQADMVVSGRAGYESRISMLGAQMTSIANILVQDMLFDSTQAEIDSVLVWYDNMNSVPAEYAKVSFYTTRADYANAGEVLSNIPVKFELTTEQAQEYSDYTTFWNLVKTIKLEGRKLTEMTPDEAITLTALHDNSEPYSIVNGATEAVWAMLTPDPRCFASIRGIYASGKSGTQQQDHTKGKHSDPGRYDKVVVYPNPASDHVSFDYSIRQKNSGLTLTVTNSVGTVVKAITLDGSTGQYHWDTRQVPAGVYVYKLSDDKTTFKVGRVVIVK
jgi:hypothetical protein